MLLIKPEAVNHRGTAPVSACRPSSIRGRDGDLVVEGIERR